MKIFEWTFKRIVPNISSHQVEESKLFYKDFLGLELVLDLEWILTFSSISNPTAQISIVKSTDPPNSNEDLSITIEVENVDILYNRAISSGYEKSYPITDEPWGVRRFFVKDPNGVTLNLMMHK